MGNFNQKKCFLKFVLKFLFSFRFKKNKKQTLFQAQPFKMLNKIKQFVHFRVTVNIF